MFRKKNETIMFKHNEEVRLNMETKKHMLQEEQKKIDELKTKL